MSDYWVNHFNASVELFPDSPLKQVGKTVNGCEVTEAQVCLWRKSITEHLDIHADESVADLCCGNGLVTRLVAPLCHDIVGVDFADNLVQYAISHNTAANVRYETGNVACLREDFFAGISKVYMYEAIQHLSPEDIDAMLQHILRSPSVSKFFIGGVPDRGRFDRFYDTEEKRAFEKARREAGQPHIGTWWKQSELAAVIEKHGMKPTLITQAPELYCSHFRFDCLIER